MHSAKITFGIIVLNGEPFTRYCLDALYPYAYEIIVVEGAVANAQEISTANGHSIDGTLETLIKFKELNDPQGKLKIITKDGFWKEKDEQSQAYAEVATGDYLWQVDIDEFYMPSDMEFVTNLLANEKDVGAVSFRQWAFWGSLKYRCQSLYLMDGGDVFHRLFKWGSGYKYLTHRPPTVIDNHGLDVRLRKHITPECLEDMGIRLYHYSLLFPAMVKNKVEYYKTWHSEYCKKMPVWYDKHYLNIENKFQLFNVHEYPGWLERYSGDHPPQVIKMMQDIESGKLLVSLHPCNNVDLFVDSHDYKYKIYLIKDQFNRRGQVKIKLDDECIKRILHENINRNKILSINFTDCKGGAAQIAYEVASHLKKNMFESTMLVHSKQRNAGWIKKLPLAGQEDEMVHRSNVLGLPTYLLKSSFLISETKEFSEADVVHLHNLHSHYFNKFALPYLSLLKPIVWTLHDMEALTGHCCHSFECKKYEIGCKQCIDLNMPVPLVRDTANEIWRDKRIIYDLMDVDIVVPSDWLKNIAEKSILNHLPIHKIPNGIDTKTFIPYDKHKARQEFCLPQNSTILAFTAEEGLHNPWKGGSILVEALRYLANRFNNITLFNIGGRFEVPGLPIVSAPYIHDKNMLARAYSAADIFAYPTLAETFGLVVAEALSCGLPVVSFKTGGVPEVLTNGTGGLLVEHGDTQGFIAALTVLIKNKTLQNEFGLRGQESAQKFSIERMVEAYEQLYIKMLDSRKDRVEKLKSKLAGKKRQVRYLADRMYRVGNAMASKIYNNLTY